MACAIRQSFPRCALRTRRLAPHRIKPHVSHRKWHQMGDTLGPADLHSRTFPQSGCGWYAALAAMARRVVLPAARSSVGTLRDNLAGLSFAPPDILERLRRHHRVTHRVGDAGVAKDVLLSARVQENLYLLLNYPRRCRRPGHARPLARDNSTCRARSKLRVSKAASVLGVGGLSIKKGAVQLALNSIS